MTKLNQILAVEKGRSNESQSVVNRAYHLIQKPDLFKGLTRTYAPKDAEGDTLPQEVNNVSETVPNLLDVVSEAWTAHLDVVAEKDWANTAARASVVVNEQVILKDVPVTFLLFLEKRLVDVHTFISKLPTLDITDQWNWDEALGLFRTEPTQSTRTKKVPFNHEKAPATEHHPAQVEIFTEDIIVGTWSATKFSGAITPARQAQLLERVSQLRDAVKFAREEANETETNRVNVGEALFDFLLA